MEAVIFVNAGDVPDRQAGCRIKSGCRPSCPVTAPLVRGEFDNHLPHSAAHVDQTFKRGADRQETVIGSEKDLLAR